MWLNTGVYDGSVPFTTHTGYTDSSPKLTEAAAFADVDGDGDLDLFIGNGGNSGSAQCNQLYTNDGSGTFSLATAAGPTSTSLTVITQSVAFGDADGDGDLDLVVGNLGTRNELWINAGDGTFSEKGRCQHAMVAPTCSGPGYATVNDGGGAVIGSTYAVVWADADSDGTFLELEHSLSLCVFRLTRPQCLRVQCLSHPQVISTCSWRTPKRTSCGTMRATAHLRRLRVQW